MARHVLVTGHEGYIGSVMVPYLVDAGFEVVGLDTGYFRECLLARKTTEVPALQKDIRDLDVKDLEGIDSVIHLAALSNDPVGNLNPTWTAQINHLASVRLAKLCREAGVRRFLFSSSCIMYGMSETAVVTEDSALDPKTVYAKSKVDSERAISQLAGDGFSPTFLRNGTVYGLSPHMRFDTVMNDLMGSAVVKGKVSLYSDGTPWRPVIHVKDVARSFVAVLDAPLDAVHNQAFNNGANHLNHQIIELAEIVVNTVPGCQLEVLAAPGADQRTYKADFGKFARTFSGFEFEWTAADGARELYESFQEISLNQHDFEDKRFTRLKWLRYLIENQRLDSSLRWRAPVVSER